MFSDSEVLLKNRPLPGLAYLGEEFWIRDASAQTRESFYELARSRVGYFSARECLEIGQQCFGVEADFGISAFFLYDSKSLRRLISDKQPSWSSLKSSLALTAFYIVINRDFFCGRGKDFGDLIKYAVEHEVREAWLVLKPGVCSTNDEAQHLLARRHQLFLAHRDGQAERLLSFYKKYTRGYEVEFEMAYQHACKKLERERNRISPPVSF